MSGCWQIVFMTSWRQIRKQAICMLFTRSPWTAFDNVFFEYLSGWLGGPTLFEQKYGHPRLRARHMPYRIDHKLKQQWMLCMHQALDEVVSNPQLRTGLRHSFDQLAEHMINHR